MAVFRFPTTIQLGAGISRDIPELLKEAGVAKPLYVTDRGVAELPFIKTLLLDAEKAGLKTSIFADASGNPIKKHVEAGVEVYRSHGADGFVIVGGGCALDVGKAIALMVNHPGDLFDYEDGLPEARPFDQPIPYMIAVPTTAGTGSEVGGSSVISDDETHAKKIIWSPHLVPHIIVADPELTVGLPPFITAATGIDALTHNVEAYLAKNYHPMCDGIALEGIRLVHEHLKQAVDDPHNIEARSGMLMASMMGAVAFQKGLGVTHSCSHALSTCYDLHHGLANALMIVPCMHFNHQAVPERFTTMGNTIGLPGTAEDKASGFIAWIDELRLLVGIPKALTEIKGEVSERLLDVALADACHPNNPRTVNRGEFKQLFEAAIQQ